MHICYWQTSWGWFIRVLGWDFHHGYYPAKPNESSMMIPGTYAEMHKDYD